MAAPDRIEHEVEINAPVQRVWELISDSGWWIGDGDRSGQTVTREGDLHVVEDPRYGRFPIRVEASEPERHIAYRWVLKEPDPRWPQAGTLLEFWLSERDGGSLLRVVESGFAALPFPDDDARQSVVDGNIAGWEFQLGVVKALAEGVTA